MPLRKVLYKHLPTLTEMKRARIGPFFLLDFLLRQPKYAERLEKWNMMIDCSAEDDFPLESFISEDPAKKKLFRKRLLKGPPPQYRWPAWTAIRELSYRINEKDYEDLPRAKAEVEEQIGKDIGRTFPKEAYFNLEELGAMGQDSLFRLLSKMAGKYPNIGYCQGMNFVAGFLLLVSGGNEVEVFYMLEDLLLESKLAGLYSSGLPYLRKLQYLFKRSLIHSQPSLNEHFDKNGLSDDSWVIKWLLSLYTAVLPMPLVLRVWDHFLAVGMKVVFKVGLTLLREFQQQMMQMDIGQLCEFLRALDALEIPTEAFMDKAKRYRLSDKRLKEFENEYRPEPQIYQSVRDAPEPRPPTPRSRPISPPGPSISTRLPKIPSYARLEPIRMREQPVAASKVPVLPKIHRGRRQLTLEAGSEYEGDDEDALQEPLDARMVLEDLLREKSNASVISLNSISNLPRKRTPELDRHIQFINGLPL
jgi:hypothetical protein